MKLLLAVDGSEAAKRAVAFAGTVLGPRTASDLDLTLFHVVESLPDFILSRSQGSADNAFRQVADEWAATSQTAGERLLELHKQTLVSAGIPAARIQTRLARKESLPEARRVVAAIGIIEEMHQGNYDVVVVGRRSTSATIQSLIGSVAEKVAREAHGRTVWIVD